MNALETLTDFLRSTDASFRIFDIGRRISKLDVERFQQFEKTQIPYPFPLLRQAWLGIIIWNPKQQQQQQIWFLRFPLDEQGKLVLAARDDLLNRLAKSVGDQLLDNSEERDPLKDNPFSFTPDQERMAAFHAIATSLLKQPASGFYQDAREYLRQPEHFADWQQLGLQGIADICARLSQEDNESLLAKAIKTLPAEPLVAFCTQLEHQQPGPKLSQALLQRLQQNLSQEPQTATLAALLRGLAQSRDAQGRHQALLHVLQQDCSTDIELLAAIGSRLWEDLRDENLGLRYLQRLAENSAGQQSFALMLQDLLYMPGMREPIMAAIRNPERGDRLAAAIGDFFNPRS